MLQDVLWVEKYRPKSIEDTILPEELKSTFQEFVDKKVIPNMILAGRAGVGKTTIAKAMLEELGCSYLVINGSMDRNIDTLRNEIHNFASTVSMKGGRKYVILDEADYLNPQSTQPALRNFIEEFSANCGFILTCNFPNRIIDPLHSRCSVINFNINSEDKKKLSSKFFDKTRKILKEENVECDDVIVAKLVKKFAPDWRRILNELQRYASAGKVDTGILSNSINADIDQLVVTLKEKNFTAMRKWVAENLDGDPTSFYRKFFDEMDKILEPNSIPQLVIHMGRYQYQSAFVADQEINTVSFLTEVMADCQFK
jgi:DNA polymerase III delta prime subunit